MRDMRARQARTWFYPLFALALGGTAILTSGCGGSGSGGGTSGRSAFNITASFDPYSGRNLPSYVGSIKVTLQTGTDTPLTYTIKRGDAPLKVDNVAAGKTYTFTVEGVQGTNGTGSKVASATFTRVAPAKNQTSDVAIDAANSEIASVSVSPSDVTLTGGASQVFTFEAKNASGATILTNAQDSSFGVTIAPNVGSFNNANNTYTAPNVIGQDQPASRLDVTIGGKSASATLNFDDERSNALVALRWNADGRGLPGYASSARISLVDGGIIVPGSERVVTRSQSGAYTENIDWSKVQDGSYSLVVNAYASNNASGEPVGSAEFPFTVGPDEIREIIDMSTSDFNATKLEVWVTRNNGPAQKVNGTLPLNEGETVMVNTKAVDDSGTVYLSGGQVNMSVSGGNANLDGDELTGVTRGTGSSLTVNAGDVLKDGVPGTSTIPINVVFGNPGFVINWDALTRDPAPSYARSFVAQLRQNGNPVPGFDDIFGNRPTDTGPVSSAIYWDRRLADGDYEILVTLYPNPDADNPATRGAELMSAACPITVTNGTAGPCILDFPSTGNATNVEVSVTRANGSVERYFENAIPGRRTGPLFLSYGERIGVSARVTDDTGTTTFFSDNRIRFSASGSAEFNSAIDRVTGISLGNGEVSATADSLRGPTLTLETRVMPPAVVAFSDWDNDAFGTGNGAVRSYLYVPGALVNSPRGDKIWAVPYRDDSYLGRAVAEAGVVLPTGTINAYDVVSPTVNSMGTQIAFTVAPFDTTSGDLTYYKDVVVMEISYDANGAPVFGAILPQNVTFDTGDQIGPMYGPDGQLYYSSMEFNRDAGSYLNGQERDIFVRTDVFAASSPGTNLTSGITGNLFWPAIAPDNQEMAVIRKLGANPEAANTTGVGRIVTIDLSPFAPSGEQIDDTAAVASRIGYLASKGVATPNGQLINDDKYYIAFARSFDGGPTTEVQLLRAERTQAALGAFIAQQTNANNPFGAAIDGPSFGEFKVTNPRRVMCYLYNNTQLMVKNVTSPASGGIGTRIYTLDPDLSSTNIPSQPVWPAPFDDFAPLPR